MVERNDHDNMRGDYRYGGNDSGNLAHSTGSHPREQGNRLFADGCDTKTDLRKIKI